MALNIKTNYNEGYLGPAPIKDTYRYILVDNRVEEVRTIVVYEFLMGDVEDPDLYAAEPMYKWEQSEQGKFVMTKAVETPVWQRHQDVSTFNMQYAIIAKLYEEDATYYTLRWK